MNSSEYMTDYKNPLHLDVVDLYLRRMGIKRYQTKLHRVWNRFIPHESQVSIYHNQGVVDSLSRSSINTNKCVFKVKTQERPRFVGCLTVVIQIRKWRLIACVVMATLWRLFAMQSTACRPLRLTPYGYVQTYQTQLYICRSTTSMCQGFFAVCVICSKISTNSYGWLGHLIGSANCDVTGQLWRHQKAVSCLGWDKSISDTWCLSRTPGCMRQFHPLLVSNVSRP